MRLIDLEPQFVRFLRKKMPFWIDEEGIRFLFERSNCRIETQDQDYRVKVSTLAEAHGILFLDPLEFVAHGGSRGTSSVEVFFAGSDVPPDVGVNKAGKMVRWTASGTEYGDLTLSPSILLEGTGGWHGWIKDGEVTNA